MSTGWLRMSAVEDCLPNRRAKGLSSGGNVMPSTISPGGRNCGTGNREKQQQNDNSICKTKELFVRPKNESTT
jgi:hypothetical protein